MSNNFKIYPEYEKNLVERGKRLGLNIDFRSPKTIQDKINWLKLYDSTPLKTKCADKIQLHDYCKEKIGKDLCIPILKIYNSVNEINWNELPSSFVMKCNHGSGMNIIVKDKSKLNIERTKASLNRFMKDDFAFHVSYEMHYHDIPHKIFVEEYKCDEKQQSSLLDYKFWCFNGVPKFYTINDGNGHGSMASFHMDGSPFNEITRTDFRKAGNFSKPINFDQMVEYSKILSRDFKFVRVDFYEIKGQLYLGELTFTPGAGMFKYVNSAYDRIVGDMLNLNLPKPMVNICIIHYNTPELTTALVKSINKFTPNSRIFVFDNSDKFPFKYKDNNITIIDNTKGQIINFDKWLSKYPKRFSSPGKANQWGSAKHCYSVEKCMEIINDNFVLLDSDVLLKNDISPLYNPNYLYIGETITQPKSKIQRILPYICYINVKECKKNGIHYFDENHMHGLCYNVNVKNADSYDTGAGFFLKASKFKHVDIECSDYIEHYRGGSWQDTYIKKFGKILTDQEWLNANKLLWSDGEIKKNKKVLYTCITGNYDVLRCPKLAEGFDYVCFTDNAQVMSNIWKIRKIPNELLKLSKVKQQRAIKVNPHKYLKEYDISIWVDGCMDITGDLNDFLSEKCKGEECIFIPTHPSRKCIYKEADTCVKMKKDTVDIINPQMERYEKEGFPKNFGLVQSNIIIRKHNDPNCAKLMNTWWNEIEKGSHRDQLSFNYAVWKHPDVKIAYLDKTTCNSEYFKWDKFHKKTTSIAQSSPNKQATPDKQTSVKTVVKGTPETGAMPEYTMFNTKPEKKVIPPKPKPKLRAIEKQTIVNKKKPISRSLRAFMGLN